MTRQWSGFWPLVLSCSVPDLGQYPTCCVLAGSLPGLNIHPCLFGWAGTGLQFHITVPIALAVLWLQLSFWVLIKSSHDQYVDCAVLAAISPPAFKIAMQPIFVELLQNTAKFDAKFAGV
jgi:hypothetical protein